MCLRVRREWERDRETGACMCLSADWDWLLKAGATRVCLCRCVCMVVERAALSLSPSAFMWPRCPVSCVSRWLTPAALLGSAALRMLGGDPGWRSWNREGAAALRRLGRFRRKSCRYCWCCRPESGRWAPNAADTGSQLGLICHLLLRRWN